MKKIRLLVADDHNIVRQGIINILEEYPDMIVVAEADDGQSLKEKYFQFKPDIILSDISMPRVNGIDAIKNLLIDDPNAKVIFLTIYNSDEFIYETSRLGAYGLVGKDVLKGELINSIRTVAGGEKYFMGKSDEELAAIKKRYELLTMENKDSNVESLTHREIEVLHFIAQGLTSEEIADKLFISKRTIDKVRSVLMEKLKIKSLPQLIRFAVEYSYKNKDKDKPS